MMRGRSFMSRTRKLCLVMERVTYACKGGGGGNLPAACRAGGTCVRVTLAGGESHLHNGRLLKCICANHAPGDLRGAGAPDCVPTQRVPCPACTIAHLPCNGHDGDTVQHGICQPCSSRTGKASREQSRQAAAQASSWPTSQAGAAA
jgi:hypothetical protein